MKLRPVLLEKFKYIFKFIFNPTFWCLKTLDINLETLESCDFI